MSKIDYSKKLKQATRLRKRPNIGKGGKWFEIWTDAVVAYLGKVRDIELADKLGISQTAVMMKRQALGVQAYGNPSGEPRGRKSRWKPNWNRLLGKYSDSRVAQIIMQPDGYPTSEMVRRVRLRLGIKSFRKQKNNTV